LRNLEKKKPFRPNFREPGEEKHRLLSFLLPTLRACQCAIGAGGLLMV